MSQHSESPSEHKTKLAEELLDDIELSRLPAENLLLKVARLARLVNDEHVRAWLRFELAGFVDGDPISLAYMDVTGRWTERGKKLGYWQPLSEIDALIASYKIQMQQLQIPNVHFAPSSANPHEVVTGWAGSAITQATAPIGQVLNQLDVLTRGSTTLSGIRSRVLALLHGFVTRVYYELVFSNVQESIFERQKSVIEARLAASCGTVLEKVPAIYDRLAAPDAEAVSQALNSCRRILDAVADSIFPPRDGTVKLGDNELKLTASHHQNRLNAFIAEHCPSDSRRKILRRAVADLYDRVSTGVHNDVSPEEARFLFLRTYLLVGEILSLENATTKVNPAPAAASAG